MQWSGEGAVMTEAQRRFAAEVHATIGSSSCDGDAVCLYRELSQATIRWIIDVEGNVLDLVTFAR